MYLIIRMRNCLSPESDVVAYWVKPKLPLLPHHCPSPPSVNPPSVCPSIHPSVRPWMGVWMLGKDWGLGRLSGFQAGVSGPPPPRAGKLRLRKERSRPLQTTTYSTTSSNPMSRLENLNHHHRTCSLFHYRAEIYVLRVECWRVQIWLLYILVQVKGLACLDIWDIFLSISIPNPATSLFLSLALCPCPIYSIALLCYKPDNFFAVMPWGRGPKRTRDFLGIPCFGT